MHWKSSAAGLRQDPVAGKLIAVPANLLAGFLRDGKGA